MTSPVAGRDLQRPLLGLSVVPFQLAYTVSIHKAQDLEYSSAKEVIPSSNSEQVSYGIFYTAVTRAKEKLKISQSADTINQIIDKFGRAAGGRLGLNIIKTQFPNTEAAGPPPVS